MKSDRRVRVRLATRLLVWIIPVALAAVAVLGASAYLIARRQILANVQQSVATIRDEAAIELAGLLRRRSQDVETVAESPLFADYFNNRDYGLTQEADSYRREIERYLHRFLERTQAFRLARYVDEKGREICRVDASGALKPSSEKDFDLLAEVFRSGADGVFRSPVRDTPDGRWIAYGKALYNQAGEFRGAVLLETDLSKVEDMLRRMNVGPSGWVALKDEGGRTIVGREPPSGPGWIVSSAEVPGGGRTVVVTASEADFLQPLGEIKLLAAGLGLLCGLLVALAIYVRVRALTEPLDRLVRATRRIAEGKLGERVFVRSGDELAALATSFNDMAKSLQHRNRELENRLRQLESLRDLETAVLSRVGREEILRTCLESAVRGLGFDRGVLYWVEGDNLVGRFVCSGGVAGSPSPSLRRRRIPLSGEDRLARVVRTRRPERVSPGEEAGEGLGEDRPGDLLAPLCGQDRVLGVLAVDARRSGRPLTDEDRDNLMLYANAAGLALENAQLVEELVQSEVRHRQVLDGSADAIVGLDRELRVTTWNRGSERIFGVHAAVARGRPAIELFPEEGREAVARLFGEAQARGSVSDAQLGGLPLGGQKRDISASCSPTAGGGWSLVLRDETEKRQLQSQLIQAEKLTAVGKLIASVAHELNNPLATIVGYADILKAGPARPAELKEALEQMHASAFQCRGIIESLLLFVRRSDSKRSPVPVRTIVDRALTLLEYRLRKAKRVDVKVSVPAGLCALANAQQLAQVLVNLVSNACDAMAEHGGPQRLRISASSAGPRVEIALEDSGPGVPPELRERIFEAFFTTKAEGEGTGLGLSISREIARGHGGDLRCEAAEGGGARFVLSLPTAASPRKAASRASQARGPSRLSVLVVDDEGPVRSMVGKALAAEGHSVELASGVLEARERLRSGSFDLVLADAMLGDGTAFDLYDQAGARRPAMVVMTGNVLDPALAAELKRRSLSLLPKPFDARELREALSRAVPSRV